MISCREALTGSAHLTILHRLADPACASAILDELVKIAVGRSEVNVALPIVLGWIIDGKSGRSELDDGIAEMLHTEPDRTVGVTHASWIGDSKVRSIRECIQVGLNTADLRGPEAEDVLDKEGHLSPMLRRSSCEDQPKYAHERSLYGIHPTAVQERRGCGVGRFVVTRIPSAVDAGVPCR
jgi:hypothetical protein